MFKISLTYNSKHLTFNCERIYQSDQIEKYKVTIKGRFIIIENNRPELRGKKKSNHKFKWKLREGPATIETDFLMRLFVELEYWIQYVDEGAMTQQEYIRTKKPY